MTDHVSILERLNPSFSDSAEDLDTHDEGQGYRAFGFNRRSINAEPMIDFITSQGVHEPLAYSHLYRIHFDPSDGIMIEFTDHVVTIQGRALREGFQKLFFHRVVFVAEADRPTAAIVPESDPVVTSLTIVSKRALANSE
ncbi:hypothetical protein [Roseiconus lacunae]|uniref:hypothetical protein n=1 Tax=Roseiconus lacunae TaxID=2605694 RepID=UPI001E597064|nr:hypothetical protein [Roseiconus lacunae]MCD0458134.1 hypothetical protein [Roseiconus lacunae]